MKVLQIEETKARLGWHPVPGTSSFARVCNVGARNVMARERDLRWFAVIRRTEIYAEHFPHALRQVKL